MNYKEVLELKTLLSDIGERKFPRKLTVVIARNLAILTPIADVIISQTRDIAMTYCKLNDNGEIALRVENGTRLIDFKSAEDSLKYFSEIEILNNTEEEINLLKVPASVLEQLDDPKFDTITANEEFRLASMIDYDN